jgi:hypothetical protein
MGTEGHGYTAHDTGEIPVPHTPTMHYAFSS